MSYRILDILLCNMLRPTELIYLDDLGPDFAVTQINYPTSEDIPNILSSVASLVFASFDSLSRRYPWSMLSNVWLRSKYAEAPDIQCECRH
jgi:hypothetical protein